MLSFPSISVALSTLHLFIQWSFRERVNLFQALGTQQWQNTGSPDLMDGKSWPFPALFLGGGGWGAGAWITCPGTETAGGRAWAKVSPRSHHPGLASIQNQGWAPEDFRKGAPQPWALTGWPTSWVCLRTTEEESLHGTAGLMDGGMEWVFRDHFDCVWLYHRSGRSMHPSLLSPVPL